MPNSLGSLIILSSNGLVDDAKIESKPISKDNNINNKNDRHHTLVGRKLINVTKNKQPTKLNLHIGPDQIGESRKMRTINNLILLSIILNQLLFPSTY